MRHPDGRVERWSYADLWDHAMEVARALVACGVGKETRVGVLMTNRPEWLSSVFGVSLAGGVAVGLSTFSTPAELDQLLKASAVSVLLLERQVLKKDFAAILEELEPAIGEAVPGRLASRRFPFLRRLAMVGDTPAHGVIETWAEFLARGAAIPPALVEAASAAVRPADPGVLLFSSGSTGKPKGILSAQRGVTVQCWRAKRIFGLGNDVRTWTANGFFWSGNFAYGLGLTLTCGGSLVLQPTFEPLEAIELMQAERVTMPYAWPHQWAQLEAAPTWAEADLSSLKYFETRLNLRAPQKTIHTDYRQPSSTYGNTETFTISTGFAVTDPPELTQGSHGEALPGNTIKVVDPLTGEITPRGVSGEIAVKGPTLMLGYIGVPADETLDEEAFFRTGDGGYIDERGRMIFQGRLNDIIKTGGANVSPVEVDWILGSCPGVKVCKTVGVPHDTLGEMVVSCIARQPGAELTEAEVRGYLRDRLASYKVPRRVLFVAADDLGLTGTAKVKPAEVRALAAQIMAADGASADVDG
jgi:fatty-acyl-CoA synthase